MQLTIEKKVEQKEFVEVPDGFYKYGDSLFKVLGSICLYVYPERQHGDSEIRRLTPKNSSGLIALALKGEMITEEEFNAVYYAEHNAQAAIVQPKLLKTA
jgi:hypothetical protein